MFPGGQIFIEFSPTLFGIVSKAGRISELKNEMKEAIVAIGVGSLVIHFHDFVMEDARELLPPFSVPEMAGLGAVAYVLKKMWEKGTLMLGLIHHATTDELPS